MSRPEILLACPGSFSGLVNQFPPHRGGYALQSTVAGFDSVGDGSLCQRTEGVSERQVVADGFGEMWRGRERREKFHRRTDWNRLGSQEDTGTPLPGVRPSNRQDGLSNSSEGREASRVAASGRARPIPAGKGQAAAAGGRPRQQGAR